MRKLTAVLLALICAVAAFAGNFDKPNGLLEFREKTIFSGELESGGFGGPVVKIGNLKDESAVFLGGRGGWIINHNFILGGGGYGLVSDITAFSVTTVGGSHDYYIEFGYGGLEVEYIFASEEIAHASVMVLIGAGGLRVSPGEDYDNNDYTHDDAVFVAEPAAGVEFNVTKFFRLNFGASYRYVSDVNEDYGLDNKDLTGVCGYITLKFGRF